VYMNNIVEIIGKKISLLQIGNKDVSQYFRIFSDPRVIEFYDIEPFYDINQANEAIRRIILQYEKGGFDGYRLGIYSNDNMEQLIGTIGFHNCNKEYYSLEIGYDLHPDYWGKGIAFEAVSEFIEMMYKNDFPFRVNRIMATTDLDSQRSIALLKRLGFYEEGVLRQYGFWKNQFNDVRVFSMLRKEWDNERSMKK